MRILTAALVMLASMPAAAQPQLVGPATAIDGGTLEVGGAKLPLWGIAVDPPETPRGWTARLLLGTLVSHGPARCIEKAPGRWQCQTADGSDLAGMLVQTGQARAADPHYALEQERAQAARVGMWGNPDAGR